MEAKDYISTHGEHYNDDMVEVTIRKIIKQKQDICDGYFDSAFLVGDLERIKHQYLKWKSLLPRVEIFYAVKACREHPALKTLADLGTSFDCASQKEIETVLELGVDASRIIFANTIKFPSALQFSSDNNVSLMTFDNEDELEKIKRFCPHARLILRIGGQISIYNFGMKFGCPMDKIPQVLAKAKSLKLSVIGVSFMVGSPASEATMYSAAIRHAHSVFQMGQNAGFNFSVLDIGGGFIGYDMPNLTFEMIAEEIKHSLDDYFPEEEGVRIIAEPGQFLVSSAYTLVLQVIGKQTNENRDEGVVFISEFETATITPRFQYYMNDGPFGAVPYNAEMFIPRPLRRKGLNMDVTYPSVVFGPTCCANDVIYRDVALPELSVGDFIYLENTGAYSTSEASDFNLIPRAQCYYETDDMGG